MSVKRLAAMLLCAAFAISLLSGCGGAASSSASSAASSEAAASEAVPSSKAEASASGIVPSSDENSIYALTDPAKAFKSSLGWGAGTAGTSLKTVIAAADMLEWAEDNNLSHQSRSAAESLLQKWYDGLSDTQRESFIESWPLIKSTASTLLTDKESISGRIEDAGLNIKNLPGCTQKNWDVLQDILDGIVPEAK